MAWETKLERIKREQREKLDKGKKYDGSSSPTSDEDRKELKRKQEEIRKKYEKKYAALKGIKRG